MLLRRSGQAIMARTAQLVTPAWVILPCAAFGVGLGYIAASRRISQSSKRNENIVDDARSSSPEEARSIRITQTPHPEWAPGQKQPPPGGLEAGHVEVNPNDLKSCYPLVISTVFQCRGSGGVKKDTLVNIEANGEFVVSIMSEWFVEAANHTCGNFVPEVDEMAESGLTPATSTIVAPPRMKESAVNMECKVRHTYDIMNSMGDCTATVIFGEVVMFHVLRDLLDENGAGEGKPTVHLEGYRPMARVGGNTYATLGSAFNLRRPKVNQGSTTSESHGVASVETIRRGSMLHV